MWMFAEWGSSAQCIFLVLQFELTCFHPILDLRPCWPGKDGSVKKKKTLPLKCLEHYVASYKLWALMRAVLKSSRWCVVAMCLSMLSPKHPSWEKGWDRFLSRNLLPNGTNTVSRYETPSLHTTVSSCCGRGLGSDPNGAPTWTATSKWCCN